MKKPDRIQSNKARVSDDGCTVFVCLRVDRKAYEFARYWAAFHADADPHGTAECQLEGYLSTALGRAILTANWRPPPEIEALYPALTNDHREDEGFPF
jgi:hypothetical protein